MRVRTAAGRACALFRRFLSGAEGEHEMLANRLAIGSLAMAYAVVAVDEELAASTPLLMLCTAFFIGTLILLAHALHQPGASAGRRLAGIVLDTGALSAALHVGGAVASPFFPVYLWVILGNGFRFGLPWLRAATVMAALGFGTVLATTPYWFQNELLGTGLLAGLVAIPVYAQVLIRKLSVAKEQAEEASRAKSLFLASVSHELRTPLNAVIGMGSLIASTRLDAAQREMTDTITTASSSLLSLIDGILDLSRIEAGQMPTTSVPFELDKLLREAMAVVELRARQKGLHLALHITARTPLDVTGDARHLQGILLNLLGNAVKFTSAGGVTLAVDALPAADGRTNFLFEVSDTGIGIAKAAQGRIFEDFVQADSTIMNRFGGTGLGLAITRRLVTLLGGAIRLHSAEGEGSTFFVALPMAYADQAALASGTAVMVAPEDRAALHGLLGRLEAMGCAVLDLSESAADTVMLVRDPGHGAGQRTPQGRAVLVVDGTGELPGAAVRQRFATVVPPDAPDHLLAGALRIARCSRPTHQPSDDEVWTRARALRVLVADDNRVNTRVLEMTLGRAGHTVVVVENGEQALEALADADYDVVLMDLNMPVMDGLKATKLFRFGALGAPHVPIIGLTADVTGSVHERCREAGMDDCLSKPIEPHILLDALDAAVLQHAAPQDAAKPALPGPVTSIADHPGFRRVSGRAVDPAVVAKLRSLGGDEFLQELVGEFLGDAERLCTMLQRAAAAGDSATVAFEAHALLSAAGNMGAEPLRQACRTIQNMTVRELAHAGAQGLPDLMAELRRATLELQALRGVGAPAPPAWGEAEQAAR